MTKNRTFVLGHGISASSILVQLIDQIGEAYCWQGNEYLGIDYRIVSVDCELHCPVESSLSEDECVTMIRAEIRTAAMYDTFVLGSMDPEMIEIKRVLELCDLPYVLATSAGSLVTPRTAYAADVRGPGNIWIECEPVGRTTERRLDHHRPGDSGFGKCAADYREGSSLGQLLSLLGLVASPRQLATMAADHCLGEAYAGKCPGVSRETLIDLYLERVPNRVVAKLEMDCTRTALLKRIYGDGVPACMEDYTYPHLPIVASLEGLSYTASVIEPDGRKKIVIGGATTPKIVSDWMEAAALRGLTGIYGDPVRGFAGGYLLD